MRITPNEARARLAKMERKFYHSKYEEYILPVDFGDDNGGYSDPWNPTGYEPF